VPGGLFPHQKDSEFNHLSFLKEGTFYYADEKTARIKKHLVGDLFFSLQRKIS
jgi:hypothetical protein